MCLVKNASNAEKYSVAEQLEKLVAAAKGLLQDISVIDYSKVA